LEAVDVRQQQNIMVLNYLKYMARCKNCHFKNAVTAVLQPAAACCSLLQQLLHATKAASFQQTTAAAAFSSHSMVYFYIQSI
jgi:hypothetical protein